MLQGGPSITEAPDGDLFGPQIRAKFALIGPGGHRAVFNDPTDPDFVGVLDGADGITGLESPEVRESAEDRPDTHGGVHGPFYSGRRPITMNGLLIPNGVTEADGIIDRNRRLGKFLTATRSLTRDGMLIWQPDGGYEMETRVRRQQPPRTPGGWVKNLQAALVAEDPLLYSRAWQHMATVSPGTTFGLPVVYDLNGSPVAHSSAVWAQMSVNNEGNAGTIGDPNDPGAHWIATIRGAGTNPVLISATNESAIFTTLTMLPGDELVIDSATADITFNEQNANGVLRIPLSRWFGLTNGLNDLRLAWGSGGSASYFSVDWRHAWL